MPPKARQVKSQVKAQQAGMMQAMSQLEQRSDEELEREQRHRAAAQAILGSRAAERYDAAAAREHRIDEPVTLVRPPTIGVQRQNDRIGQVNLAS